MNAACRRFFCPGFPDLAALRHAAFTAYRSMAASSPLRPDPTLADAAHDDLSRTAEDMPIGTPEGSIGVDDKAEKKARAGDVLTRELCAMMLRDLAKLAGMRPDKAHRYLVSFLRLGVVAQDPLTGRYELGGFALQMGLARLARVDGVQLARVALAQLRERLDTTFGIAAWGNQGATVAHWMESSRPAKASLKLGDVMPLLGSATGRLFAAYLPRSRTHEMIERELADARRAPPGNGPHNEEDVERMLAEVRRRGGARVKGVLLPMIDAFCMPVFDAAGELALGLIALGQEGASTSPGKARLPSRCAHAPKNSTTSWGIVQEQR
jgi:DNA-binding IclR family transcriptional regulator